MIDDLSTLVAPAYVAVPDSGTGPGVVVLHAWWGLNDFFTRLCNRLAQAGFVAVAPDLYDGKIASTVEEAERLLGESDVDLIRRRIDEAITFLRRHPAVQGTGIGLIGFSMGGAWALLTSTTHPDDVAAVVIFYGNEAADYSNSRAAYLGHFAEDDPWEPSDGVQQLQAALQAAGRDVTFYTYSGVGHWFFEDNRPEYDAKAARLAWERSIEFLRIQLA